MYVFNAPFQRSEKGKIIKSIDFPHLTRQRHVHPRQLDRSCLDNTCLGSGAWQATSTWNSLTCRGYHTQHRTNTRPHLGARQTSRSLLVKTTTTNIKYSSSTPENLFCPQANLELGGLMYYPWSTKYTWHPTWHSKAHVNPPCQPCNRSTDTQPLATNLPNWYVISNLLICEYFWISFRLVDSLIVEYINGTSQSWDWEVHNWS